MESRHGAPQAQATFYTRPSHRRVEGVAGPAALDPSAQTLHDLIEQQASAAPRDPVRPTLGWERYATGRIRVNPVAGNHFTILDSAHVGELAGTISRILARPRSRESEPLNSVAQHSTAGR